MGNIVGTAVKRFSPHHAHAHAGALDLDLDLDGCINGRHGVALCEEVGDNEMRLAECSGFRSGCVGHVELAGGDGRRPQNGTIGNAGARQCGGVDRSDNSILVCDHKNAAHVSCDLEDTSTLVSRVSAANVSLEKNSRTSPGIAGDLENSPAVDRHTHTSDGSTPHGVSPANSLFGRGDCDEIINGAHNLDYERTLGCSVKYEVVPDEDVKDEPCVSLDVRGCGSAPKASIKRRANRKRINRQSSNRTMVLNENTKTLVPLDVKYPEMANRHPFTQSRAKALSATTSPEPSTRSGRQIVPRLDPGNQIVVYDTASQHVLTHNKGVALSISTPESLKPRSTRSGRLIVPRLDPGSQDIIYGMDGSICGITNFDPRRPQGFYSEPPPKRRKKS